MGYSKWSDDAYDFLKDTRAGASADDIFTNNRAGRASDQMLPTGVKFRESRDSDIHPDSLAITVFLDETGSMGRIPEVLVREKLGPLMNTLIDHGVPHPQILFGGTDVRALPRTQLRAKVVDAPEVLTVVEAIPHMQPFLNSLYYCRYRDFFQVRSRARLHRCA